MTMTDPIERLAAARPVIDLSVVDAAERERVLRSIVAVRPAPRRGWLAALAVPAVAAAAAAALLLPASAPPPMAEAPAVAVLDHVRLAMATAEDADMVLHVTTDYGNGVLWDSWHDAAGRRSRELSTTLDGKPLYDHELTPGKVRVVSYQARAWWEYAVTGERGEKLRFDGGLTTADIRAQLDDGTLDEVGPETLDGRAVLHLRWQAREKAGVFTAPGDLWVDATTYLPLRTSQSRFEWLPRTAAAEANLTMPLPAGFVHSPTPIEG